MSLIKMGNGWPGKIVGLIFWFGTMEHGRTNINLITLDTPVLEQF